MAGKGERSQALRIVGIVDTPAVAGPSGGPAVAGLPSPSVGGLYVHMAIAETLHGIPGRISFVGLCLAPGADITSFRFGWAPRLGRFPTPVQFQEAHDIEEALDESASAENVRMQAFAATGLSLLIALLVIFCNVSMGSSERTRLYAMLRAIAMTRREIALMVTMEAMILATIGFLGGLGVGAILLHVAARGAPGVIRHGCRPGLERHPPRGDLRIRRRRPRRPRPRSAGDPRPAT